MERILELERFLPYRLHHLADLVSRDFAQVYKDRLGLTRPRWLARAPDENDRRVEHLTLTRAGVAAYREMVPLARAFEAELLHRLHASERAAIDTALKALEKKLTA